jgi:hypothetical protein
MPPGTHHTFSYKGFLIRAFEQSPQCWFAEVRKSDGAWVIVAEERRETITTSAPCHSFNAAVDFAIDAIDSGAMK